MVISSRVDICALTCQTGVGRVEDKGERCVRARACDLAFKDAIPVRSVEAGIGFSDLTPLKQILEGVWTIGLGEATHGAREFFLFEHHLFEFLVQELGWACFT